MSNKKIIVITYKRKSSKEEVDREEPLARQNQLIEQARHWKGEIENEIIVAELYDQDLSGSTDKRPGLQTLIRMAKAGDFDRAYIGITSRLFRDLPNGPEILFQLREVMGKEIIFGDVLIPQTDPYYKRYEAQRFLDAQTASIDGSIGAKTGQKQLFDDGFKVGGRARYGYRLKKVARGRDRKGAIKYNSLIVPNPPAFVIASEILNIYAKGKLGARAIANDLNRRNIPSPSAWDSWGSALFRCSGCKYSEVEAEAQNKDCPLCERILLSPQNQKWNKVQILSILSEAEWTYSGHYRANYCSTRIKHGDMSGRYKGGYWEGLDYKGQKLKPMNEWRIRRNNHPPAITADICARVLSIRTDKNMRTPGGRRRLKTSPFTIVCGLCGSLYSRRGEGLLSCSGRDRKMTGCTNRGIKEDTIYPFVIQSVIKNLGLLSDPEAILSKISAIKKEKKGVSSIDLRREKAALTKKKRGMNQLLDYYLKGQLTKAEFDQRLEREKQEGDQLNETISQLKHDSIRDMTLFNSGDIFEKLFTGEALRAPESIQIIATHIKKLVAYVTLHPIEIKTKKRTVGVSYSPFLSEALKQSVPKGTLSVLTVSVISDGAFASKSEIDLLLELVY